MFSCGYSKLIGIHDKGVCKITNLKLSIGFRPVDYLKISLYGAALALLWSSLHTLILPLKLLELVPEALKNSYLSLLTFSGLILAMIVQPLSGAASDRSFFAWGRRSPYILVGTLLLLAFLPGIAFSATYLSLFFFYCFLQVAGNIAQGPFQAFIPDLVTQDRRGTASGVKSLIEILTVVALLRIVAYFADRYFAYNGVVWLWFAFGFLGLILLLAMIATVVMVKESQPAKLQSYSLSTFYNVFRIDVKRRPDFFWFLLSRFLVWMALATLQTYALYYFRDVLRVENPAEVTANLLITVGVSMIIIVYPMAWLSDRLGRIPLLVFSGMLGALGIFLLLFSPDYGRILLCGSLLGIAIGTFMSVNWALATDLVAPGEEGRYLGLTNLATAGAAALARFIGPGIDFLNAYNPGQGYLVMLVLCYIYFTLGTFLLTKVRPGHYVRDAK